MRRLLTALFAAAVAATPATPAIAGGHASRSLSLPLRAAFYYGWYPETWTQNGIYPATRYRPVLGYYHTSNVIARHVAMMRYAHLHAGIASWWGQGSKTDRRVPLLLNAASGTGFKWTVYYEREGYGDPAVSQIESDLAYLYSHYATSPAWLWLGGKPAVFVYADVGDGCGMARRWAQANSAGAHRFYVVLKVFPGYSSCASQPNQWHQYAPALATDKQAGHSYAISPGFWKYNGSAPRLARHPARWASDVRAMAASGEPLQLVTTFNEWGEGTAVEPAAAWRTNSGEGTYLDTLHAYLPP
jgi:hypothetical protein